MDNLLCISGDCNAVESVKFFEPLADIFGFKASKVAG